MRCESERFKNTNKTLRFRPAFFIYGVVTNDEQSGKEFLRPSFFLPATILILVVGWARHLPLEHAGLNNFSPVAALFLCGAIYLRGTAAWVLPAVAVVLSDLVLNPSYGKSMLEPFMLATYGSYALVFWLGRLVAKRRNWGTVLGGAAAGSVLFYLITCTFVWIGPKTAGSYQYALTLEGWWQAVTLGDPRFFPPAYIFLRNSLLSDLLFTGIFAATCEWALLKVEQSERTRRAVLQQ